MAFGLVRSLTGRLEKVDIAVATMGGLVEEQVRDAIAAFERGDAILAQEVITRDLVVDEHERDIERLVVAILDETRTQGAALRRVMAGLKLAAEMERVGDLAKNVAKRAVVVASVDDTTVSQRVIPGVVRMGHRALGQFRESLDSLFRADPAAARAVRDGDDQIDDLYNSIYREIIVTMGQYVGMPVLGTHLIFVAKNFERIGDHATNIAERVHFTLTGEELPFERAKSDTTLAEQPHPRAVPGK